MAIWIRALVVACGAMMVLVGFGWRDLEENWGLQWDYPYEVIETIDKKAETRAVYRSGPGGVPVETIWAFQLEDPLGDRTVFYDDGEEYAQVPTDGRWPIG